MVAAWGFVALIALCCLGLFLAVLGAFGQLPDWNMSLGRSDSGVASDSVDFVLLRGGLAFVGAVAGFLLTRWPIVAVYCGVAGFVFPTLVLAKRRRKAAIAKLEAIAVWVESLRDTMAASAGLQQAIQASVRVAPGPIRTEVRDLSTRLQHQSIAESLRRFAADVRHPLSDMVVAALILATSRHAGSLQSVLATTAHAARDQAAMWRQVESGRTRMYSQAKIAGWVTGGMMLIIVVTRREILSPYDSVFGQIVLAIILGMYISACYWIYRLGKPMEPRRVFADVELWSDLESRVLR